MTRPIEEVVVSQNAMVNRLRSKGAELDAEQLERGLTAHRNETCRWMKSAPHVESIEVDYPKLMNNPEAEVKRILAFLGPDRLPTSEKMMAMIDPSLYRRRQRNDACAINRAAKLDTKK
jgi:hypothetical protein